MLYRLIIFCTECLAKLANVIEKYMISLKKKVTFICLLRGHLRKANHIKLCPLRNHLTCSWNIFYVLTNNKWNISGGHVSWSTLNIYSMYVYFANIFHIFHIFVAYHTCINLSHTDNKLDWKNHLYVTK